MFLAVIILLNVIVSMLSTRFPSINLDLSAQKTNSLTEDALKVVDAVKLPTTITILGPETDVRDNVLYSGYGFNYSQVAVLSDKVKERNSNITVKYVDLDKNPTYASELGETNLTAGCVVVSTEKRHRVLQITDLFSQQTDYTTGAASTYSMVWHRSRLGDQPGEQREAAGHRFCNGPRGDLRHHGSAERAEKCQL